MKLKKISLGNVSKTLSEMEMKNVSGGSGSNCKEITSRGCRYWACLGPGGVWNIQYTISCLG